MNLMKSKTAAWSQGPEREGFSLGGGSTRVRFRYQVEHWDPRVVELAGIEPAASALQRRRSPS